MQSSRDAFAKHVCFPVSFLMSFLMSGHPKVVHKSFSLISFLQNRRKCFRKVMDKKIVLTEPAE